MIHGRFPVIIFTVRWYHVIKPFVCSDIFHVWAFQGFTHYFGEGESVLHNFFLLLMNPRLMMESPALYQFTSSNNLQSYPPQGLMTGSSFMSRWVVPPYLLEGPDPPPSRSSKPALPPTAALFRHQAPLGAIGHHWP